MILSAPSVWLADRRSQRVAGLLGVIWIISLADLFLTIWAHRFTPFDELNPIASAMLYNNLIPSLVIYKFLVNIIGTAIFWNLRYHDRAEGALWTMTIVYVLLAFHWSGYTMAASTDILLEPGECYPINREFKATYIRDALPIYLSLPLFPKIPA